MNLFKIALCVLLVLAVAQTAGPKSVRKTAVKETVPTQTKRSAVETTKEKAFEAVAAGRKKAAEVAAAAKGKVNEAAEAVNEAAKKAVTKPKTTAATPVAAVERPADKATKTKPTNVEKNTEAPRTRTTTVKSVRKVRPTEL